MTGIEPLTSGVGSDRSTNGATTTALNVILFSEEVCFTRRRRVTKVVVLLARLVSLHEIKVLPRIPSADNGN